MSKVVKPGAPVELSRSGAGVDYFETAARLAHARHLASHNF